MTTPDLLLPTAKRVLNKDGELVMGTRLAARVARAAYIWKEHPAMTVICVGGYSYRNGEQPEQDPFLSEAGLAWSALKKTGIPEEQIAFDPNGGTIYGAIGHAINDGYIIPKAYSAERRLGVVASTGHFGYFERVKKVLVRSGIDPEGIIDVPTMEAGLGRYAEPYLRWKTDHLLSRVTSSQGLLDIEADITGQPAYRLMRNNDRPAE